MKLTKTQIKKLIKEQVSTMKMLRQQRGEKVLALASSVWDEERDNDGQVIFRTGLYRWADGSIHPEMEETGRYR
jgi:hypothetical protein